MSGPPEMKKILVIGGSYFAGRVFVEELVKTGGFEVHLFNRGRVPLGIAGVIEHVGDRHDPARIRQAIPPENWDAVVDFCCYEPGDVDLLLDNLPGRIGHAILISTTSVYAGTRDLPVTETAPPLTGRQDGDYPYDKWLAECRFRERCGDIPQTIFRPAIIYGYYNYAPRETYFFDLLREKKPFIIPDPALSLFSVIWVVDMARILIASLGDPRSFGEAYNLASAELISYPRLVEVLEEITGKTIAVTAMSPAAIDRQKIPLPFPLTEHLVYSGAKAARTFPIEPTPFKVGIRESLKYYLMVKRQAGQ